MKSFVTEPLLKIEGKGKDSFNVLNPARGVFTTNSRHAIKIDDDDRRFAIFNTVKENFTTPEYFDDFLLVIENKDMLEKFMYELMNRKIISRLNKAPMTAAKQAQKVYSADKISEWFDSIISTRISYQVNGNFLWNRCEDNEKWMFKETALESYSKFPGNKDGIDTTNKLYAALEGLLANHKDWGISNDAKRLDHSHGFAFGKVQRMWILKRKTEAVADVA